jgi:hypothetical protein
MNIRRGLNRVFFILGVVWALYLILAPPLHIRREASEIYKARVGTTYQIKDEARRERERHAAQEEFRELVAEGSFTKYWTKALRSYEFWGVLLVPPLVVYGVAYGLIVLVLWVVRGFQSPA